MSDGNGLTSPPDVKQLAKSTLAADYDFIVCGAGSSGSVVARRIAENPDVSVLLIEAGTHDESPSVMVPALWPMNLGSERDWGFVSEPNPHINNRALPLPMGKVLGGGSSINVMMWARGHQSDWDFYAAETDDLRWGYKSVVDIYRRIEDWGGNLDPSYRGSGGPIAVRPATSRDGLGEAGIQAAHAFGLNTFEHPNGLMMEKSGGAATADVIVVDGRRQSVFRSYVHPILGKSNLTVVTEASVARLVIERNRVTGVELYRDGTLHRVVARGEVVLALGAVNSPKVLMQSGIGDASELHEFSIEVHQHLPGVGKNLQDHPASLVNFELRAPFEATNQVEAQLFWASESSLQAPDVFCCLAAMVMPRTAGGLLSGCGLLGSLTHPRSRGSIRISGAGHDDPPRIDLNTFSDPDDVERAVRGFEFMRDLGNSRVFRPFVKRDLIPSHLTGDELRTFIRNGVVPYWHFSGTAKMGGDSLSVVGSDLRVHGMENLRVADASVLPRVTAANTMAPCVVIGERAAECIRERHSL